MTDTTTIEVRKDQAQWLKDYRRENGNYKTAIDRLIEIEQTDSTEQMVAEIEPLLEGQDVSKGPQFDDVVQACRKALRDELPERVLQR